MSDPAELILIGGGRWARVLLGVLTNVVKPPVTIVVHSPRNADGMAAWIEAQDFPRTVRASHEWPAGDAAAPRAAIVANAARDHEMAIDRALASGWPVLAEKPVTLSHASTVRVAQLAQSKGLYLAAANVLLFASHLARFASLVANYGPLRTIRILWKDPLHEIRYGDTKRYDSGIPVVVDVASHIISILEVLRCGENVVVQGLRLYGGGACVELDIVAGGVGVSVVLARDAERRERVVEVHAEGQMLTLDFSVEPGTIVLPSGSLSADESWNERPSPLRLMLSAFLESTATGVRDTRLDVRIGLSASYLADQALILYREAQLTFVRSRLARVTDGVDDALRYALTEMLQYQGGFPREEAEEATRQLHERLTTGGDDSYRRSLASCSSAASVIGLVTQ